MTVKDKNKLNERDLLVLEQLEAVENYITIPMLQYRYPILKQYTRGEIIASMVRLITRGYVERFSITRPEREQTYKLTNEGAKYLETT